MRGPGSLGHALTKKCETMVCFSYFLAMRRSGLLCLSHLPCHHRLGTIGTDGQKVQILKFSSRGLSLVSLDILLYSGELIQHSHYLYSGGISIQQLHGCYEGKRCVCRERTAGRT